MPLTSLNAQQRNNDLRAMAEHPVDVLVIGGGITGAGIALDAASRGLETVLLEAHDLAFGTSRWSSKLAHGGLRYLATGNVAIARRSAIERGIMLERTAPHLVRPLAQVVDPVWASEEFVPRVARPGAEIIEVRGASSAASAASAAIDHLRDWTLGTGVDADGAPRRTSAAVVSDGSYGVPEGLISSFPVTSDGGTAWRIVPGLEPDESVLPGEGGRLAATVAELEAERDAVRGLGLL